MIKDLENQINNSCRFCNPPEKERILFETDNFYVMLSLGPIVEGYTLIVSKQHIGCCAEIPDIIFDEFVLLYKKVKQVLVNEYGHCIAYEHGKAGSCLVPVEGSKHCFHSHMHFVPVSIHLNKIIDSDFQNSITIDSLYDFKKTYNSNPSPYLFADDKQMTIYPNIYEIRSQYLRYKTATEINCNELWDWVKFQGWDKIQSSKLKLINKFTY